MEREQAERKLAEEKYRKCAEAIESLTIRGDYEIEYTPDTEEIADVIRFHFPVERRAEGVRELVKAASDVLSKLDERKEDARMAGVLWSEQERLRAALDAMKEAK